MILVGGAILASAAHEFIVEGELESKGIPPLILIPVWILVVMTGVERVRSGLRRPKDESVEPEDPDAHD